MAKDTVIVEGTMYWNNCTVANKFAPTKHSFELSNLTDAAIEALRSLGADVNPRTKEGQEERGQYITLKQAMSIGHMKFTGPDGAAMTKEEVASIGNGSKVKVKVGSYTNGYGTFLSYVAGKVTELKVYNPDGGFDDEDDFGDLDESPFASEAV
jgi:hypothetical protein